MSVRNLIKNHYKNMVMKNETNALTLGQSHASIYFYRSYSHKKKKLLIPGDIIRFL